MSKESTKNRYCEELAWLNIREKKWKSDKVRVGVIGVTSSGKSTLINAILGEELLSTAVKPSSSQLVSCIKSKDRKGFITFKSGEIVTLEGGYLTKDNLKKYTDEDENAGNIKEVEDILLTVPGFDIDERIVLIDSAGLDAYKLEAHEKLSLEVLLPTIDICVFVTTLKTNSDAKTNMVLNTVARHNCPIIIVQNMLDSLEESADGTKTKHMIGNEHKKRLLRIIDKSDIKDKSLIKTIQISALNAMKNRGIGKHAPHSSHYNSFVKKLNSLVEEHIPHIENQRSISLYTKFIQLISEEEIFLDGSLIVKDEFIYEGIDEKLSSSFKGINENLEFQMKKLSVESVNKEYSKKITDENVNELLGEIKKRVKSCESNILSYIIKYNKILSEVAKSLNIPLRDLVKVNGFNEISEPQVITEIKMIQKKTEKAGAFSNFSRWIGDKIGNSNWGYKYENVPRDVLDKTRTINEIDVYVRRAHKTYMNTISNWVYGAQKSIEQMNIEIEQQRNSYKLRQQKIVETTEVSSVMKALKILIEELVVDSKKDGTNYTLYETDDTEEDKTLQNIELSKYQKGVMELSRILMRKIHQSSLSKAEINVNAPTKKMILAWDMHCLLNFSWRFMGIKISDELMDKVETQGVVINNYIYIADPSIKKIKKLRNENESLSIYILVNAHQDGAAKKQIDKLKLSENISKEDRVFFVIQDFDSLIAANGISEMKYNLSEYYKEFVIETNMGMLLINDDNPLFNLAYVHNQIEPCQSLNEEQKVIQILKERFNYLFYDNVAEVIGDLIRSDYGGEKTI
ncbi:dynamin family protein [Petrocella atlantisensis]|nr:dynamin family protein [Petrocella atlantisensis]